MFYTDKPSSLIFPYRMMMMMMMRRRRRRRGR